MIITGIIMDVRYINKLYCRVLIALSFVFGFASFAYGAEYSLFTSDINSSLQALAVSPSLPGSLPQAKQRRPVSLNPVISTQNNLTKGDVLNLSLFAGTSYTAQIDRVSTNISGTKTIRGRIDGFPLGYMLISTDGNRNLGSVSIPERDEYYLIQYESGSGVHYLLNIDANQLDILNDEPSPALSLPSSGQSTEMNILSTTVASNPLDTVTLDVMILYTPAARAWANSSASGIGNVVAQAVSSGQLTLDNSNTYVNLNFVYSGEVSYTESGDAATDLERLTFTTDEFMNEVQTLRDQYNADVVALFEKLDGTGGIAWLLENTSGNDIVAFSIIRVQQAAISNTYIHEMGHNMGCGHHKQQTTQPGPGLFSYSAGWRWTGTDNGKYCSVMSYTSGDSFPDGINHTQVAYFSNPNVLYKEVATGDSVNGDNARTIREIKSVIANYRKSVSSAYIDIGLRYYDGTQIVKVACEPQGTLTSPLRISKNRITFGIVLVDPDDPYASGIIIQTSSGKKAIRKL